MFLSALGSLVLVGVAGLLRETRQVGATINQTSEAVLTASSEAVQASHAAIEASRAALEASRAIQEIIPSFLRKDRFGAETAALEHEFFEELKRTLWTTLKRERNVLIGAQALADRAVKRGYVTPEDLAAVRAIRAL